MIGAGTNVLVRYFVEDDPVQSRRVDALLARGGFHIDDVVLCELVWVLRSDYRFDRPTIAKALGRSPTTRSAQPTFPTTSSAGEMSWQGARRP